MLRKMKHCLRTYQLRHWPAVQKFNKMSLAINLQFINGGPQLPLLFTSHSYRHLEGIFWLKWQGNKLGQMAGKLNWLEWQGKKISSKETSKGIDI